MPVWTQVNKRINELKNGIKDLEDKRDLIVNGQTEFNDLDF
jgi:hypothetical protein